MTLTKTLTRLLNIARREGLSPRVTTYGGTAYFTVDAPADEPFSALKVAAYAEDNGRTTHGAILLGSGGQKLRLSEAEALLRKWGRA